MQQLIKTQRKNSSLCVNCEYISLLHKDIRVYIATIGLDKLRSSLWEIASHSWYIWLCSLITKQVYIYLTKLFLVTQHLLWSIMVFALSFNHESTCTNTLDNLASQNPPHEKVHKFVHMKHYILRPCYAFSGPRTPPSILAGSQIFLSTSCLI